MSLGRVPLIPGTLAAFPRLQCERGPFGLASGLFLVVYIPHLFYCSLHLFAVCFIPLCCVLAVWLFPWLLKCFSACPALCANSGFGLWLLELGPAVPFCLGVKSRQSFSRTPIGLPHHGHYLEIHWRWWYFSQGSLSDRIWYCSISGNFDSGLFTSSHYLAIVLTFKCLRNAFWGGETQFLFSYKYNCFARVSIILCRQFSYRSTRDAALLFSAQ